MYADCVTKEVKFKSCRASSIRFSGWPTSIRNADTLTLKEIRFRFEGTEDPITLVNKCNCLIGASIGLDETWRHGVAIEFFWRKAPKFTRNGLRKCDSDLDFPDNHDHSRHWGIKLHMPPTPTVHGVKTRWLQMTVVQLEELWEYTAWRATSKNWETIKKEVLHHIDLWLEYLSRSEYLPREKEFIDLSLEEQLTYIEGLKETRTWKQVDDFMDSKHPKISNWKQWHFKSKKLRDAKR